MSNPGILMEILSEILSKVPEYASIAADDMTIAGVADPAFRSCLEKSSSPHEDNEELDLLHEMLGDLVDSIYRDIKEDAYFDLRSGLVLDLILGRTPVGESEMEYSFIREFNSRLIKDKYLTLYSFIQSLRGRIGRCAQRIEELNSCGIKCIGQQLLFGHVYDCRSLYNLNTEYAIRRNWVYRDREKEQDIFSKLLERHLCVVEAAEGRGKSVMCGIIGYEFYKRDSRPDVYFVDLRNNGRGDILNVLEYMLWGWDMSAGSYSQSECLLILENLHNFSDCADQLERLVGLIYKYIQLTSGRRFYFLLNTRPSEVLPDSLQSYIVNISPDEKVLKEVISLNQEDSENRFFERFKSLSVSNDIRSGFNLRLLNLCLDQYSEAPQNIVVDPRVIAPRILGNILGNLPSDQRYKEALFYVACISQFDLPVYVDEGNKYYETLCQLAQNGACVLDNRSYPYSFQLGHPLDAWFLARGLKRSDEEYAEAGARNIIHYVEAILNMPDCSSFEAHFELLMKKVKDEKEWANALSPLYSICNSDGLPARIVESLNPGMVLVVFSCKNIRKEDKLNFYFNHKDSIVSGCRRHPVFCCRLCKAMKKYYDYDICRDVFPSTSELEAFLEICSMSIPAAMRQGIISLGGNYSQCLEAWKSSRKLLLQPSSPVPPVISHSSAEVKWCRCQIINKALVSRVDNEYKSFGSYSSTILSAVVKESLESGFLLRNLSWRDLGTLIYMLRKLQEQQDQRGLIDMIDRFLIKLQQRIFSYTHTISKASNQEFSLFLKNISSVNNSRYNNYVANDDFVQDMQLRLARFTYQEAELYLFSHFFCNPTLRHIFEGRLSEATAEELESVKAWVDKVEKRGGQVNQDSLLGYLKEVLENRRYDDISSYRGLDKILASSNVRTR